MSHTAAVRPVRLALFAAAIGLLGLLGWHAAGGEDLPPQQVQPEALRFAPAAAGPADGRAVRDAAEQQGCLGAPVGSTFRYRVVDRSDYRIHSAEAGTQPAGTLHVECFVLTTVLARRQAEVLVQHQFEELRFLGADGREIAADPIQASFAAAVVAPVLARIDEHGRGLGYAFAEGLDGDQRNFLRGMLAVVTWQAPAAGVQTWTCEEADTTGEYEARYELLAAAAADEVAVRRTRLRYKTIAAQAELPVHELRGAGEARFSTQLGWLRTAKLDEGMTMTLPLLDLQAITHRQAEAVLVAAERTTVAADLAAEWSRATAAVSGRFEQVGKHAVASERRRWEQQLQGVTLDQLLAELAALLRAEPVDSQAVDTLFQKMQWLAKLDERVVAAIGEQVATQQLAGELAGMALSSLGAAGTPASQAVLAAVRADRSLDAGLRETATIATLQLAEPAPALVEGLARDAAADFDGRASAMLVLGALSTRTAKPLADGRTPVQALLAMEADAVARGELSTWLLAVGNATPPETLAIVQRHLGDRDAAVRSAACVALRRVTDGAAVELLVERGLADADPMVRREALLVLARRPEPAARTAIERIAQSDTDEELRHRANELLRSGA